jgi:arsenic resistance protein ArsH
MQVSDGSQSFNAVHTLRLLGRWMWMITISNQSSAPKASMGFDDNGRMKRSSYCDRIVDVMEELMRFTRGPAGQLVNRYSGRKASGVPIDAANDLYAIAIRSA